MKKTILFFLFLFCTETFSMGIKEVIQIGYKDGYKTATYNELHSEAIKKKKINLINLYQIKTKPKTKVEYEIYQYYTAGFKKGYEEGKRTAINQKIQQKQIAEQQIQQQRQQQLQNEIQQQVQQQIQQQFNFQR